MGTMKRSLGGNGTRCMAIGMLVVGFAVLGCTKQEPAKPTTTPQRTTGPGASAGDPKAAAVASKSEPSEEPKTPNGSTHTAKNGPRNIAKPASGKQPNAKLGAAQSAETPEVTLTEQMENVQEKPRDLGPPLVDDPNSLIRLSRDEPIWIDRQKKQVVLQGEVCRAGYPLEFFATYSNRAYESVVSVNVKPSTAHAALLAVGAKPGHPARFQPEFVPPTGTEVAIDVRWKDDKGKLQTVPAQYWIRNIKTGKQLDSNWVFAGSGFIRDEATGKEYYQADSGELICVLSLPNAMLDLPLRSYGAMEARSFEAFEEHLPAALTPVTIILKPILNPKDQKNAAKAAAAKADSDVPPEQREAIAKALEVAQAWLGVMDRGEYSQGWDAAADYLKKSTERREFVKSVTRIRKLVGPVKARDIDSKEFATSLPGAPAGQYVILVYKTEFADRPDAVETIIMALEKDKKWRVSGYNIQ